MHQQLVRGVVIVVTERVAGLQVVPVGPSVDLLAIADHHGRGHPRQQPGVHLGERGAVRGLQARLDDVSPGQPTPPPPQVVGTGRDAGTATVPAPIS